MKFVTILLLLVLSSLMSACMEESPTGATPTPLDGTDVIDSTGLVGLDSVDNIVLFTSYMVEDSTAFFSDVSTGDELRYDFFEYPDIDTYMVRYGNADVGYAVIVYNLTGDIKEVDKDGNEYVFSAPYTLMDNQITLDTTIQKVGTGDITTAGSVIGNFTRTDDILVSKDSIGEYDCIKITDNTTMEMSINGADSTEVTETIEWHCKGVGLTQVTHSDGTYTRM